MKIPSFGQFGNPRGASVWGRGSKSPTWDGGSNSGGRSGREATSRGRSKKSGRSTSYLKIYIVKWISLTMFMKGICCHGMR